MRDWTESSLAERLNEAMKLRSFTLGELSRRTGMAKGPLSRLVNGERVEGSPASLRKIADATQVSYEWLSHGRGQPVAPAPRLDTDALPNNLRELVEASHPGTYSEIEVRQAAMYRDLKGRDLPQALWHEYILGLRREAKLVDAELAAATGTIPKSRARVVTEDPVAERRAARAKKTARRKAG